MTSENEDRKGLTEEQIKALALEAAEKLARAKVLWKNTGPGRKYVVAPLPPDDPSDDTQS